MTDQDNSKDLNWPSLRSQWREQERDIRAPSSLLNDVFHRYETRKARQKIIRFGVAVAASLVLIAVFQMTQHSVQDTGQPVQVSESRAISTSSVTSGPCDVAGSCVDLEERLALVDFGWPSDDERIGILIPN